MAHNEKQYQYFYHGFHEQQQQTNQYSKSIPFHLRSKSSWNILY